MGHKKEKIPLKMTETQRRSLERFLMKKNEHDLEEIAPVNIPNGGESHSISLCAYGDIVGNQYEFLNSGLTVKEQVAEIKRRRAAWWRKNKKW